MVGRLLSLYLRAGVGVANLALRTAARGAELAIDVVRIVAPSPGRAEHKESEDVFGQPAEPMDRSSSDDVEPSVPVTERSPAVDYDREPAGPIDETVEKAKSIDDEAELVAEFAEPGAEDGASAEVEVDEPWEGYDELTADQIVERVAEADAAALAVIELYEQSNKQRRTVLNSIERRQRELANTPS